MDLRLSISTSRHGKSVWFEQRYCLSKQTNGIKAIGNVFQRKLSNNRLRHLRPSFTRLQVYLTIIRTHQIWKIMWRYFNGALLCNWQGAYCGNRQLAIRFAAAAWCLACFVLVQAYSSTLIAFITSPNNEPIINSVYDIPKVPGLKITVNRNFAADLRLLVSYLPLLWDFFDWVTFFNLQYSLSPRV